MAQSLHAALGALRRTEGRIHRILFRGMGPAKDHHTHTPQLRPLPRTTCRTHRRRSVYLRTDNRGRTDSRQPRRHQLPRPATAVRRLPHRPRLRHTPRHLQRLAEEDSRRRDGQHQGSARRHHLLHGRPTEHASAGGCRHGASAHHSHGRPQDSSPLGPRQSRLCRIRQAHATNRGEHAARAHRHREQPATLARPQQRASGGAEATALRGGAGGA